MGGFYGTARLGLGRLVQLIYCITEWGRWGTRRVDDEENEY